MELYLYGTILGFILAYAFYKMHDGWLRKIFITGKDLITDNEN